MTTIRYFTSLLTFYLKGQITIEPNFVKFSIPNTILGLIPLGAKKETVPVNQIASTQSNFKLKLGKLLLGGLLVLVAIGCFTSISTLVAGFLILLIGANLVIDAFEIDLEIVMTSGQKKYIDFFIFDKGKAEEAEKLINAIISNRLDDTNNRQQTDRIVDAINNK